MAVISKSAVKAFVRRELRDHRPYKEWRRARLEAKLQALDPPPVFHTKPRKHQKLCFYFCVKRGRFFNLLDLGLGKTKLILDLIRYAKVRGKLTKALVLVPNTANIQGWLDEVAIHAPDLRAFGVTQVGSRARLEQLNRRADLIIVTYAGWMALTAKGKQDKRGNDVKGWALDLRKADQLAAQFNFVAYDECTAFRNHTTLCFRACWRLSKACAYRYGLTGTPFGKDPEGLWSQFYMIDHGETLGPTIGLFRAAFCKSKLNYWSGFPEYSFDRAQWPLLNRMIQHNSIRYRDKECNDLPPLVEKTVRVVFPEETWAYYDRLVEELREAKGNFRLVENAFIRMRQLTSGYLRVKDPEGDMVEVKFKENPKLEALLEYLTQLPPKRKAIIFHEYKPTGQLICKALRKARINHVWLHGGASNKPGIITAFKTDARVRVLVASSSGAFGHNLQKANYVFWYEQPTDPIIYEQERGRCYRTGQTRRTYFFQFLVKGSVDERNAEALAAGKDLFKRIVNGDREVFQLGRK